MTKPNAVLTDEEIFRIQYELQYGPGGFDPTTFARLVITADRAKQAAQVEAKDEEHYRRLESLGWQLHDCRVCGEYMSAYSKPPTTEEKVEPLAKLDELLAEYWSIAFDEATDGKSRGDDANAVLAELRALYTTPPASRALVEAAEKAEQCLDAYSVMMCIGGGAYDPECADEKVQEARSILTAAIEAEKK